MKLKKYLFLLPLFLLTFIVAKKYVVFSGEFENTSATLNNARLSFLSALEGAQTTGSSLVTIDTTNYPSESVLQLQNRDNVLINDSVYTVATTVDDTSDNTFNLTSGLDATDVTDNATVYGIQTSSLTVRLKTISALSAGSFRILVPAVADDGTDHNDVPDSGGFDFGSATPASVTCPTIAAYGTFTGTSTPADTSTVVLDGVYYHSFVCSYDGLGEVGTDFDGTDADPFVISNLINPAPKTGTSNHTLGQADTYAVIIQHRDTAGTVIDQTTTKIGVVDAVKVSAHIAPQITFTIAGISAGTDVCGLGVTGTNVATTALTVPFGDLTIGSFTNAAQRLTVTTNAIGGYSVTAAENDQVGREANACDTDGSASITCIVDASVTGASHTAAADWTDASTYPGFGYSLAPTPSGGGFTPAFYYNESGTFYARQFADLAAGEAVQTIFSRNTVAASDVVDVCYRIAPAATNAAGNYENYLVYTASATF